MRTMQEVAENINEEHSKLVFNLYERWQDEKEYEDFNDYVIAFKKVVNEAYKGTKRPFGFSCKCSNGEMKVFIKRNSNNLQLMFISK